MPVSPNSGVVATNKATRMDIADMWSESWMFFDQDTINDTLEYFQ